MTTLAFGNECIGPWNSALTSNSTENLEARFWAALNFAIDDVGPSGDQAGFIYNPIQSNSRAILVNSRRPPPRYQDNSSSHYSIAPPRHDVKVNHRRAGPERSFHHRKNSGSLTLKVPSSKPFVSVALSPTRVATSNPFVSVTLSPSMSVVRSSLPASATKDQWHLPKPDGTPPSSAALELVSNFLDTIVKLSDSKSSTPAATVSVREDGDVSSPESEVLTQVSDDINRTAFNSSDELRKSNNLVQLQIPPPLIPVPGGNRYDIPSAIVASGPAACTEKLDALSWMAWDRQLSNVQHAIW